jgi:hypothetical protein
MRILAIDPGNFCSGWVIVDTDDGLSPLSFGKSLNADVLLAIGDSHQYDCAVIEMIASYGMPVGAEVFDTCVWIGRFTQALLHENCDATLTFRKDVKVHHCHSTKANDANVTQALVDRFARGAPNRGKGTKGKPGFFHGFSADIWQAYALAVQHADTCHKDGG